MRYTEIINEGTSFVVSIQPLRMSVKSVRHAFNDLLAGRYSRTKGPVIVYGTEYNQYQLADGYHRVLQAILNGQTKIRGKRDIQYSLYYAVTPENDVWVFDPRSPTFGLESAGISTSDIEKMKQNLSTNVNEAMSPWDFDQNPSLGWRSIQNPAKRIAALSAYIRRYVISANNFSADCPKGKKEIFPHTLIFHLGQLYAMQNDYSKAIKCFERASTTSDQQWNNYVKATIAFLRGDQKAFEKSAAGKNYNSDTLNRLRAEWGKPYSEAY